MKTYTVVITSDLTACQLAWEFSTKRACTKKYNELKRVRPMFFAGKPETLTVTIHTTQTKG